MIGFYTVTRTTRSSSTPRQYATYSTDPYHYNREYELARRINELERRFDTELQEIEARSNQRIDELNRETVRDINMLNRTIKLMTRRTHHFGSKEYIYMDDRRSWYEAEESCEEWGGHLASVVNYPENKFLRDLVEGQAWIGVNDVAKENRFVWTDSTAYGFTNWKHGQPDNGENNENCAVMAKNGEWSDILCSLRRPYLCKRSE